MLRYLTRNDKEIPTVRFATRINVTLLKVVLQVILMKQIDYLRNRMEDKDRDKWKMITVNRW